DEPTSVGGGGAAPGPYDYLLIGLGACTSMTVGFYARSRKWPLDNITVSLRHSRIHAKDCAECETKEGMLDRIDVEVGLTGALTEEQRAKLMEIAGKCPVTAPSPPRSISGGEPLRMQQHLQRLSPKMPVRISKTERQTNNENKITNGCAACERSADCSTTARWSWRRRRTTRWRRLRG